MPSELHAYTPGGIFAAGSWLAGHNPGAPGMEQRRAEEPVSGLPSRPGGAELGGEEMETPVAPQAPAAQALLFVPHYQPRPLEVSTEPRFLFRDRE